MDQTTSTLLIAVVMVGVFLIAWWRQVPHIISLTLAAIVGALVAGQGLPLRHFVEGSFLFIDLIVIILTASIFMGVLRANGALSTMITDVIKAFHKRPLILLSMMTLVVMVPGAFTGSGTAAVLAVGSLVGSVLMNMGIPRAKAVAIVALAGIAGSFAPPVNIPAMAMANGINMPYSGMFLPLLLLSVPIGIITTLALGARHVRRDVDVDEMLSGVAGVGKRLNKVSTYGPLVLVVALMVLAQLFPSSGLHLGTPLIFLVGIVAAWLLSGGQRLNIPRIASDMIREAMPVASILVGVGAFVQIMTLTGVRGLFVITAITLPDIALFVFTFFGFAIAGSLLGSYGSGTVFGIPVAIAFLDRDPIMSIVGLSILAAYSSLTPPTAIVGQAAAVSMQYKESYNSLLRYMWLPWLFASIVALLVVIFADRLNFLVFF